MPPSRPTRKVSGVTGATAWYSAVQGIGMLLGRCLRTEAAGRSAGVGVDGRARVERRARRMHAEIQGVGGRARCRLRVGDVVCAWFRRFCAQKDLRTAFRVSGLPQMFAEFPKIMRNAHFALCCCPPVHKRRGVRPITRPARRSTDDANYAHPADIDKTARTTGD